MANRVRAAEGAARTTEGSMISEQTQSNRGPTGSVTIPSQEGIWPGFVAGVAAGYRRGAMSDPAPSAANHAFPRALAAFEHLMLADARPGHPMTFFIECEVEGTLSVDRLRGAVSAAARRHPLLRSRVAWREGRPWWLAPDVEPTIEPDGPNAWRPIDITQESGLRLVVVAAGTRQRVVMVAHHAALDGVAAGEFFGDLWACYDGREPPAFSAGRRRMATAAVAADTAAPGPFAATWPFVAFRPQPLARSAALAAATAVTEDRSPQPPFASHTLDRDQTTALRGVVTAHGWSLNDLVVAAVMRAVGRWNERAGRRSGNVRITLPVSLRAVGSRGPAGNDLGYAFLDRTPAECADPRRLVAGLAEASRWIVETGAAREFVGAASALARRPWLLRAITRLPVCFSTAVVSTIGDPSRRMKAGVPKHDGLDAPGGLVIRGIRGVPPLRPGTRAAVGASTYGGELTLSCLCSAVPGDRPSQPAAREFAALVAAELTAFL